MWFKRVLKIFVVGAVFALAPAVAFAGSCQDQYKGAKPIIDSIYDAMVEGAFVKMTQVADPDNLMELSQKQNVSNVLENSFSGGFDRCEVLIRRVLSNGITQEIAVFSRSKEDSLFFYSLSATINGRVSVLSFNFSQNLAEQVARLR